MVQFPFSLVSLGIGPAKAADEMLGKAVDCEHNNSQPSGVTVWAEEYCDYDYNISENKNVLQSSRIYAA